MYGIVTFLFFGINLMLNVKKLMLKVAHGEKKDYLNRWSLKWFPLSDRKAYGERGHRGSGGMKFLPLGTAGLFSHLKKSQDMTEISSPAVFHS